MKVAVFGAGTMGSGIAQVFAAKGHTALMYASSTASAQRKRRGVWCFVSSAGLYCLFPGRNAPLGGVGALPGSKLPPGI